MRWSLGIAARSVTELLFPSRCVHCKADGALLCRPCLDRAVRLDGPVCRRCALPLPSGSLCHLCAQSPPPVDRMIAVFQMDGPMRDAVHALKYDGLRAITPVLGAQMASHAPVTRLKVDVVAPVPLHSRRMRSRGYNQSELLARNVASRLGLPVDARSLRRVLDTPPQVNARDERERERAMAGAFAADGAVSGKRVLLVDDVATTGSTLNSCARALKAAGAVYVCALTLAREV